MSIIKTVKQRGADHPGVSAAAAIWSCLVAGGAGAFALYRSLRHPDDERRRLQETAASLELRNAQLTALSNVFVQITHDLTMDKVVNATLRETLRFMEADLVTIRRLEGDMLLPIGSMARDGTSVRVSENVRLGYGLTGKAAAGEHTVRIDRDAEISMSPRLVDEEEDILSPSQQLMSDRQESGVIVPLIVGSRLIGTLAVWSRRVAAFTAEDEHILEMMASQVATAITAAASMEESERQAHIDPLTGLPNRLQLKEDLEGVLAGLAPEGRRAVFGMADIDRFKRFNDEMGHSAGDDALREAGRVLRESMRESGCVYRFGGDEFVMVFLDATVAEAEVQAEKLRRAFQDLVRFERPVTISIGLAAMPDHSLDPAALIELADAALYRAKDAGRDRIVCWSDRQVAA